MGALSRMGVRLSGKEILEAYSYIDEDESDKITYQELIEAVYGRRAIDFEAFVRKRRQKLGLDTGISRENL